jgi:hypothetical protein
MKKIIIIAIFICSTPAWGDEPPSFGAYSVYSPNSHYVAWIVPDLPERKTFTLSVSDARRAEHNPLWSIPFDHFGYEDGILSNDGSTFAQVSFWYYHNDPVVIIYRNGMKTASIKGKAFGLSKGKLDRSVSHTLWFPDSGYDYEFVTGNGGLYLRINTRYASEFLVDTRTGNITKQIKRKK